MNNRPKLCGIITKTFGAKAFMLDNLRYAAEKGPFESYFICERSRDFSNAELEFLSYIPLDIKRGNVSPFEVMRCILQMYKIFKQRKFDIIQYASSNSALYAAIAGWLARVPVRIYCQWGISYTDYQGFKLWFYKTMVKVTCFFSTHIQPDSFANLTFAISEGLYKAKKGSVIGKGSATGVDMNKYDISRVNEWKTSIKSQYNIPVESKVFGFVGRLVPEKGVNELFEAFIAIPDPNVRLLVVGPNYETDRLNRDLWVKAHGDDRIVFCGPQHNTAPYYAAMDFLVLPSYREGFGAVVLEAGAMGIPSICSDIKGPTDFVKHRITGLICAPRSSESLLKALNDALVMSDDEYNTLAANVFTSVKNDFDAQVFRAKFVENRIELLNRTK